MSLFIRKGTVARKHSRKYTVRRDQPRDLLPEYHEQKLQLEDEKSICVSDYSEDQFNTNYGSIFLQLQEAKEDSEDIVDYLIRSFEVLWNSAWMTCILLLLFSMPIAILVVGSSYREECPVEPTVPIYLLIFGVCGFLEIIILLWRQKRSRNNGGFYQDLSEDFDDAVIARSVMFTGYLFICVIFSMFIVLNICIFSTWKPNFKQILHEPDNWCNETLYMFTFYVILTCYCLLLVFVVCVGVICIVFTVDRCRNGKT